MKKLLTFLLLACLALAALTACGEDKAPDTEVNPGVDETTASDGENKEFVPEIITAEQIDPRKVVIDYMYKMANLEWTPSEDIDLTEIISTLYYKKGVTYHGIMYVTGDRTMTDYDEFMAQLNENNEYTGPIDRKNAWGNHCSSAIRLAYDQVERGLTFGYTGGMIPSKKQGTIIVGEYTYKDEYTTTDEIIAENTPAVMYEAYSKLQPGDCILTCWGPTGHARMILEVKVEKSASGKINPGRSYVTCIEQTSSFDKQAKDGINTTWYVEHLYTFSDLQTAKYIPLTIKTLQQENPGDNTFSVKSLNNADNIMEGKLKGLIRSDHCNIKSATVEILNSKGEVVVTEEYENKNNDPLVFQFSNRAAPEGMKSLASGEYSYVVTANTLYGSAKVAKVDFTVK